jgi:hypothetical protein
MILTGELKSTHRVRILGEGASIRFDVANVRASHEDVVVAAE